METNKPLSSVFKELEGSKKITVCSECLTAACWHGEYMCDSSRYASTVEKTVDQLIELNKENLRESPFHWYRQAYVHGDIGKEAWEEMEKCVQYILKENS